MSKNKEALVTEVTNEQTIQYGKLCVGFYDNPRQIPKKGSKDGELVTEDRLYISIDISGQKDHIKRKAKDDETRKFRRAYELYLAAKKAGGKLDKVTKMLDTISEKDDEISALKKQLAKQQEAAKKEAAKNKV
jgi:hypothetical protein